MVASSGSSRGSPGCQWPDSWVPTAEFEADLFVRDELADHAIRCVESVFARRYEDTFRFGRHTAHLARTGQRIRT